MRSAARQRLDELLEVSAVIALRIVGVVVELGSAGIERHEQRFMEPAPVGDRLRVRLLGEHVGVAVGGLEGRQRAHHGGAMRARHERREGDGALDVSMLVQRIEGDPPQHRIGDLSGSLTPVAKPAVDARKNRQPVAQRRIDERRAQRGAFTRRRRHIARS